MEKISAVLLGADTRAVLRRLGGLGVLELIPAGAGPDTAPLAPPDNGAALARCRSLVSRLEELRRLMGPGSRRAAGAEPALISFEEAASFLSVIEEEAKVLLERKRMAGAALAAAASSRGRIAAYAALPLPSDRLGNFSFLRCFTGSLPLGNFRGLADATGGKCVLSVLSESGGRAVILGLADRDRAPALEEALRTAGFRAEEPPGRRGLTLEAAAAYFAGEEKNSRLALAQAEDALAELAGGSSGTLTAIERAAADEEGLLEAEQRLPRTAASTLLYGWAPAPEGGEVRLGLAAATAGRFAAEYLPAAGDAPVLLRPPALFKPFAGLVRAYGLPGYGEVDPTAFAAAVYVLLFGAMFGDVGHGAVICLAALAMMYARRKSGDAALMMLCCGLTSTLFGLVYGSFFGLGTFKKYALWRDPLEGDPFILVLAALGAGAAVISLGVALNIINRARSGDRLGAALGRFGGAGLVFYWCAILMLAGKLEPRLGVPVLVLALVCWALKEPLLYLAGPARGGKEGGMLEAVAESLVGTFEGALLYLANTVSFARLAAYAMSHAALLASAYMLAASADKAWGPGSPAGVAAIIAGNAAAITLEGVVAAVQALRLEYYEFFGKFFEGGGRPFKPFVLGTGGIK